MTSPVDKHSYWLHSGESELATHAHLPAAKPASRAVLICGTVGFEAIHSYRCMVRLGDELAENGVAAFRFDYAGNGNSSGNAEDAELVAAWRQNIIDQARDLKERWGFADIVVIGFRLGATLSASVLDDIDVSGLAFWEPVNRGKSFVREIRAVSQFAEDPTVVEQDRIESGGFVFTTDTLSSIADLRIDVGKVPDQVPVLLLSRGKNPALKPEAFANGNPFEELRTREYDRMICEPHYTEIPVDSIACIIRWHASLATEQARQASIPELSSTAEVLFLPGVPAVEESTMRTAAGSLFGIVSRPRGYVPGSHPTVVLPNAGSVCSVGPNRVYVQTARALSAAGLEVVRFDLRNLGDSVTGDVPEANAPYPGSAGDDVSAVLAHCRESFGSTAFVLAGLCSGSHASYHFALERDDPDVKEIVLINPLTFYFTEGMSLDNPLEHRTVRNAKSYVRSAREAKNWRRLLTGQINYRRLTGFALRVMGSFIRNSLRKISSIWTHHPLSRMDEDLAELHQRGLKVSYIFSETDPGYWIARVDSPNTFRNMVQAGESAVVFIENADHTLSTSRNREDLIAALRKHLLPV